MEGFYFTHFQCPYRFLSGKNFRLESSALRIGVIFNPAARGSKAGWFGRHLDKMAQSPNGQILAVDFGCKWFLDSYIHCDNEPPSNFPDNRLLN